MKILQTLKLSNTPYRDTSKKDDIYRRKAKKKAIKILTTNEKRKVNDE